LTFVEALRSALAERMPAVEVAEGAVPAGVLVPLQYHDGEWHVILNVRSDKVGQHKGEIAFPGGRLEPDDPDMTACALRETWEEMGINPQDVDVLGPLNALLTRTNFLVWPTLGVVPHPYAFRPDPGEVAKVIEVPLPSLMDESSVRHEARLSLDGTLLRRTAYSHGNHLVFGATAWILSDLLDLVNEVGWNSRDWSRVAKRH
jgi:8-oxo-dGTP pyrophosphatase MutT (NUDIX family)